MTKPSMNAPRQAASSGQVGSRLWRGVGVSALGLIALLLVAAVVWSGWRGAPLPLPAWVDPLWLLMLAGVIVALALLWLHGLSVWRRLVVRLLLVGVSLAVSVWMAEKITRVYLRETQGFNAVEMLAMGNKHRARRWIQPRHFHPLCALVELSKNKRLIYELIPNLDKPFNREHVVTNGDGMRESRDYTRTPPPNVVRIVGVGDSGMFGWDVSQGEDYLAVLEERLALRTGGRTYEVLNMGVPAYNTQQELELLKVKGLGYSPSVVVLGWCSNDGDLPIFLYERKTFDDPGISYFRTFFFNRNKFVTLIKPDLQLPRDVNKTFIDPELARHTGLPAVKTALAEMVQLAEIHGFQLLVFGPLGEDIEGILTELGIKRYNTLREIPADAYPDSYMVHWMHPSPEGHAVLAEHLELALERFGLL